MMSSPPPPPPPVPGPSPSPSPAPVPGPAIAPSPAQVTSPSPGPQATTPSSSGGSLTLTEGLTPLTALGTSPFGNRESYKDRKRNYQRAKKRVAEELLSTLSDPTVVVLADWLKIRGTLKGWTKVWCELKPGLLVLYKTYKTHKGGHWVGTVLLNACEVIERPSKKDGFCFKLFHPLEQSLWASRGPKGESFGAIMQPLPMAYLIFRAPSEQAGKTWIEAIELSFRCSSLLVRNSQGPSGQRESFILSRASTDEGSPPPSAALTMNESEIEQHFKDYDLDDEPHTDHDENVEDQAQDRHSTDTDSDVISMQEQLLLRGSRLIRRRSSLPTDDEPIIETPYIENSLPEEFGDIGDAGQTEEVADENKSLLWTLLKQVRPGMDLSKVVLPTFILEPRSFLEKLSDYYFHCDILSQAVLEDDPLARMKSVVKWYLSGFYKKPKGLKKPYNPILGETFRCYWNHPETQSRTFYMAEQVSHHPPVSAFYVTNRKDGFCIHGSILAKSKFYGNSVSAVLDGTARLTLLTRGEDYTLTMPYAHCKGILMGTLTLELGGKIEIKCEKTGYYTEMEFKLKPFLGGSEYCNLLVGKIKLGKETLASIEGHWDTEINIKDKKSGQQTALWMANNEVKARRLKRFTVPMELQSDLESEKLWRNVSAAILRCDQISATEEKTILEEEQRKAAKERMAKLEGWSANHFVQDVLTGDWIYKHADSRPWDPRTDVLQYERDFVVQTKTRHKTPTVAVRTNSVVSIEPVVGLGFPGKGGKGPTKEELMRRVASHHQRNRMTSIASKESGDSSSPESKGVSSIQRKVTKNADSTDDNSDNRDDSLATDSNPKHRAYEREPRPISVKALKAIFGPMENLQRETRATLEVIQSNLDTVLKTQKSISNQVVAKKPPESRCISLFDVAIIVFIAILSQSLLNFFTWNSKRFGPK